MRFRLSLLLLFALPGLVSCASGPAAPAYVDVAEISASGEVPEAPAIASAGQPDEAALRAFADAGYSAVIDLRGPQEDRGLDDEKATVEGLGMDYIALPITGRDALSFESASELDAILQGIDGPVLVHCGSGNRVGALLALRHSSQGAGDEAALELGRNAGLTGLEGLVKERLAEK